MLTAKDIYNQGYSNTGDYNLGSNNTGNRNIGNHNSGDYNIGNYNTGWFNLSDNNPGIFSTMSKPLYFFDRSSELTMEDWLNSEAYFILSRLRICCFVYEKKMSDFEKESNPSYKIKGGYLKFLDFKECFYTFWNECTRTEHEIILSLPNFNKEKFHKITGVLV